MNVRNERRGCINEIDRTGTWLERFCVSAALLEQRRSSITPLLAPLVAVVLLQNMVTLLRWLSRTLTSSFARIAAFFLQAFYRNFFLKRYFQGQPEKLKKALDIV